MAKKITSAEFFDKNNAAFMKFGRMFTRKLTDQELINALLKKTSKSSRRCSSWCLKCWRKTPLTATRSLRQ